MYMFCILESSISELKIMLKTSHEKEDGEKKKSIYPVLFTSKNL